MKLLLLLMLISSSAVATDKSLFIEQVPLDQRAINPEAGNAFPVPDGLLECEQRENAEACRREPDPSEASHDPIDPQGTIPIIPGVTINQPPVIR